MNKGITLLVLVAVLGAMGLVLYSHSGAPKEPAQTAGQGPSAPFPEPPAMNGQASPLQNLQGPDRGLAPVEPPITSGRPPAVPEGAPVPVTLGPDGRDAKRPSAPEAPAKADSAAKAPAKSEKTESPVAKTPAEAPKAEPAKSGTPAPPAKADTAKPDAAKAPPAGKSPSTAPGLEPWTVPPPAATSAQSGAAPAQPRPQTGPASGPASVPGPDAAPLPPAAEQRLATDPIKPARLPENEAHTMSGIRLSQEGQTVRLRLEADSAFPCKTFVLTGPDRLVIDLPGAWKGVKAPAVPQNPLVKNARLGQQPGGPRLVLDLHGPVRQHRLERSGTVIDVLLYN